MDNLAKHLIQPSDLQGEELFEVSLDEEQLADLAKELNLAKLTHVSAKFYLYPIRGKRGVKVTGLASMDVGLICGVTLEAFDQHLEEEISVSFLPEDLMPELPEHEGDVVLDHVDGDLPELLDEHGVNLMALVQDSVVLAVPAYPRKPEASFEPLSAGPLEESPFAALKEKFTGLDDKS